MVGVGFLHLRDDRVPVAETHGLAGQMLFARHMVYLRDHVIVVLVVPEDDAAGRGGVFSHEDAAAVELDGGFRIKFHIGFPFAV